MAGIQERGGSYRILFRIPRSKTRVGVSDRRAQ